MEFYKKPPLFQNAVSNWKTAKKCIVANMLKLMNNINEKFHEILMKTEGDISKSWNLTRNNLFFQNTVYNWEKYVRANMVKLLTNNINVKFHDIFTKTEDNSKNLNFTRNPFFL